MRMIMICNVPDEVVKSVRMGTWCGSSIAEKIIANGISIPENATNGDVIKVIFPNTKVDDYDYGKDPVIDVYGIDDTEYITLRKTWWNAPYKEGSK